MRLAKFLACLVALVASPVTGAEFHEGDECRIGTIYEPVRETDASTVLFVSQDQENFDDDDTILIYVKNDDWSIKWGDTLGRIKLENEDGDWLENDAIAIDHGFFIYTSYEYFSNVFNITQSSLHISRGGKTIDRLSLTSWISDLLSFSRCREPKLKVKREAERQKQLEKDIPKDPFSGN